MATRLGLVLLFVPLLACGSDSSETSGRNDAGTAGNGSFGTDGNGDGGANASDGGDGCNPNLTGLVRDFRGHDVAGGHPDFENYNNGLAHGLVAAVLGADRKPVFASTNGSNAKQSLTGKTEFDQWYRNVDGVNQPFEFVLPLQAAGGVLTYDNPFFFPIDGRGFGNSGKDHNGVERNFGFTFELHLDFVYRGGETFKFTGDDDLWAFFNGKLGIDLGGVHGAESDTIDLDAKAAELGISKGEKYPLDVFQAERHTSASNFRIDTTLEFVNCDKIILPR